MTRTRNAENKGLPTRWKFVHGAYYYRVPEGQEAKWDGKKMFRLGATLPEAYKVWAARIEHPVELSTVGQLLDRYALEVVPTKAVTTQAGNLIFIKQLRAVFGLTLLDSMRPQFVYKYVDLRSKKTRDSAGRIRGGVSAAHREIEVLSHAFTKAVEWGYIDRHPFKDQIRLAGERPRDRYVEDWEVLECLSLTSRRKKGSVLAIQAYIRVKLLTGMARGDLLRLEPARHFKEDGIHIQRHKTANSSGKRTIYEWSDELRQAVELAKVARPVDIGPFLFCNRWGQGYIDEATGLANGWDSMWQHFMERVLADTKVDKRFTEHDLRAKCASDALTLEHARALLSHADSRTTDRIYRRKAERVKPLR